MQNVKTSLGVSVCINELILERVLLSQVGSTFLAALIVIKVTLSSLTTIMLLSGRGICFITATSPSKGSTSTSVFACTSTSLECYFGVTIGTAFIRIISSRRTRTASATSVFASILSRTALLSPVGISSFGFVAALNAVVVVVSPSLLRPTSAASVATLVAVSTVVIEASLLAALTTEMSLGVLVLGLGRLIADMGLV